MQELFARTVKGNCFLKWSQRYHPKTHPVPLAAKGGGNLRKSLFAEKSGVCSQPFPAVFPWKCSFSFTVCASSCNYSSPALSLLLQHNLHWTSGSKPMVWSRWSLQAVIRIMSNRRQSHGVSIAHLKCSTHPKQSLSPTEMSFPCRGSGAATEIGSPNILGWINQLLQLSITCKEFCCISICWSLMLLLCNGLEPWSTQTESHMLPNNTTKKLELRSVGVWASQTPSVSNTTFFLIQCPAHM